MRKRFLVKFTSELRDATCQWDHTVLSATRQRWPLRLHPNRAGWYSIYRPRKDERLSWCVEIPRWIYFPGNYSQSDQVTSTHELSKKIPSSMRHRWAAVLIHLHYGFVRGRHDAAWQTRSRNPQDWDLPCLEATHWVQQSLAFLDAAVQLLHVRGAVCQCTVLLKHRVVTRHFAYSWQHHDVIMTLWSSIEEDSK